MLNLLKKVIPDRHPLRLLYHRIRALIAVLIYRFPSEKLIVIGVTGTNGKTTTVNLITNILTDGGHKVGMTSSINFQIGDKKWPNITKVSTLSPFKLQKLLRRMVTGGCKYAVIEVTSHAVTQSRVSGINFDVGVITNVTPEHIDYHGSFDNYLRAKGKFFSKVSKGRRKFGVPKILVLNSDDENFNYFDKYVADRKLTYGMSRATVYASDLKKEPEGSKFAIHVPNDSVQVEFGLPGEFNVYNALAAGAVCLSLQIPLDLIKKGIESSARVAGRYEHVDAGQDFSVIVDYAHTPEALENLFAMYKRLTEGRLFAVFGATGGGRDKSKRPVMGKIADEHADYIVVTNDDPYWEDEWGIVDQVSEGISRMEGDGFWKIPDRREAIRLALTLAREGDTVVVAGKGCEEIIMLKEGAVKWNDKKVIEELLGRDVEVEIGHDEQVK